VVDKVYLDKGYQYDKTPVQPTTSSGDSEPAKKRFSAGEGVAAKKRSGKKLSLKGDSHKLK
jgi:hypothetical protein